MFSVAWHIFLAILVLWGISMFLVGFSVEFEWLDGLWKEFKATADERKQKRKDKKILGKYMGEFSSEVGWDDKL